MVEYLLMDQFEDRSVCEARRATGVAWLHNVTRLSGKEQQGRGRCPPIRRRYSAFYSIINCIA